MSKHSKSNHYLIQQADWNDLDARARLYAIRAQVFVAEQGVAPELEWDELDENALHLLAYDNDSNPIGCARIVGNNVIGRMAVLKEYRGQGVGSALLTYAIDSCRAYGFPEITLSAQVHAMEFYRRAGFITYSDEYLDAGIAHRDMKLGLNT